MSTAEESVSKRTTMQALKPVEAPVAAPQTTMGFANLQSFELMQRAAKLLASSSLVPTQYQGNLANCVIALNMAQRMGADPLMVMQNLYVVHGRPAWSGQFTIACFNQCGRFSAMRYRWFNEPTKAGEIPDAWGCQAYATELATGDVIEGPIITIAMAKREGWYQRKDSKWQSIPQLMLMYRAGAWLTRTHAPEITMGLQTAEEVRDVYDARRGEDGHYEVTIDNLRTAAAQEPEQQPAETIDTETGEVKAGGTDADDEPQQQDAVPYYDEASAIKALEKCRKSETLRKTWQDIQDDYVATGRELPFEIRAKFDELEEVFAEREAQS